MMTRILTVTSAKTGLSFGVGIASIVALVDEGEGCRIVTNVLINQVIEGSQVRMVYAAHDVAESRSDITHALNRD